MGQEMDDSDTLAALLEEENAEVWLATPRRPIQIRRTSKKRDIAAIIGFLTLLVSVILAYANLCNDVKNAANTATEVKKSHDEAVMKIGQNNSHINEMKLTLQRVDTTQQEVRTNIDDRLNRQDIALGRILDKLNH